MPVSCMPSPESPEKRTTILSTSFISGCFPLICSTVSIVSFFRNVRPLSGPVIFLLFQHVLHQAHSSLQDKHLNIVEIHENPGIPCIFLVPHNRCQDLKVQS